MKRREFHRICAPALLGGALAACDRGAVRRVACEGDSLTYGHKVEEREKKCYPAQLQRLLGPGYEVRNFGLNGVSLKAYMETAAAAEAEAFQPHIVVMMLGSNDSKSWAEDKSGLFVEKGVALLDRHRDDSEFFVCLPPPVFPEKFGLKEVVILNEIIPRLREVAEKTGAKVVDLHTPFLERADLFPDLVHPSAEACEEMARIVALAIRDVG